MAKSKQSSKGSGRSRVKFLQKGFVILIVVFTGASMVGLSSVFTPNNVSNTNELKGDVPVSVPCLYSEVFHIHPQLSILVDDLAEQVPGGIGILPGCIRELHTHDADGAIHVESAADRGYTLANFLTVWGRELERDGYALAIIVDGIPTESPNFRLEDGQRIVLEYSSIVN